MDEIKFLEFKVDKYKGITVDSIDIALLNLESLLKEQLKCWQEQKYRVVWIRVALCHSEWVPVLTKLQFNFHHAEPGILTMVRLIDLSEPYNIPRYAHNLVGAGALVVNDRDELLVVVERYHQRPHWKLPGGYLEFGEDIEAAAEREVLEETGVEAKAKGIVAFRHAHNRNFDCSDLYFVIELEPQTTSIRVCEREIEASKWVKISDYLKHESVIASNKYFVQCYLEQRQKGLKLTKEDLYVPALKSTQRIYTVHVP